MMAECSTPGGVKLRCYEAAGSTPETLDANDRPAVVWFHGGGYMLGGYEDNADLLEGFVIDTGCVAISVEYRLAPEHPYPAALDDAYEALCFVHDTAADHAIDPARIAVAGGSAGGGLAACLALLSRDNDTVPVAFQLLIYPLLDDRATSTSAKMDTIVWTKPENAVGLTAYLGRDVGTDRVPQYAMAARAESLVGLPRTALFVGELDLFRDDVIAYASRLYSAGVSTDLRVVAGMPHAADGFAPDAAITKRFVGEIRSAFAAGINASAIERVRP